MRVASTPDLGKTIRNPVSVFRFTKTETSTRAVGQAAVERARAHFGLLMKRKISGEGTPEIGSMIRRKAEELCFILTKIDMTVSGPRINLAEKVE